MARPPLTNRQRRILADYSNGNNQIEIAVDMNYAPVVICRDIREAKKRLGADNLAQACLIAIQMNYLRVDEEFHVTPVLVTEQR